MRTIAIVNQKGGCGKTTTAINLSAELAHRARRTLLVDLDPQGHCAAGLNVPEKSIVRGVEVVLESDLRYHDSSLDEMLWEVGSGLKKLLPQRVGRRNSAPIWERTTGRIVIVDWSVSSPRLKMTTTSASSIVLPPSAG